MTKEKCEDDVPFNTRNPSDSSSQEEKEAHAQIRVSKKKLNTLEKS